MFNVLMEVNMIKRNTTQSEIDAFLARGGEIQRVEENVRALNATTRQFYRAAQNGEILNPKGKSDSVMDMRKNTRKNGVIVTDGAGRKLLVD
jgi:hypothetical protein